MATSVNKLPTISVQDAAQGLVSANSYEVICGRALCML